MAHVWYEAGNPLIDGPCPDCFTTAEWAELRQLGEHANTACAGQLEQDLGEDHGPPPGLILHDLGKRHG